MVWRRLWLQKTHVHAILLAVPAKGQAGQILDSLPDRDQVVPIHGQHPHGSGSVELLAHPAFAALK